jgi:hypothetical protein
MQTSTLIERVAILGYTQGLVGDGSALTLEAYKSPKLQAAQVSTKNLPSASNPDRDLGRFNVPVFPVTPAMDQLIHEFAARRLVLANQDLVWMVTQEGDWVADEMVRVANTIAVNTPIVAAHRQPVAA